MASKKSDEKYFIETVIKADAVLEVLRDGPSGPAEIGRLIGVTRNTAFRHLKTFEKLGKVRQVPDSDQYELDSGVIELALSYLEANHLKMTRVTEEVRNGQVAKGWISALVIVDKEDSTAQGDVQSLMKTFACSLSHR